jgi:hypothetical protein
VLPQIVSFRHQIPCFFAEEECMRESPQLPLGGSVHYYGKIALMLL